jgi:hypothetical protein
LKNKRSNLHKENPTKYSEAVLVNSIFRILIYIETLFQKFTLFILLEIRIIIKKKEEEEGSKSEVQESIKDMPNKLLNSFAKFVE